MRVLADACCAVYFNKMMTRDRSVVFEAVDMPYPRLFHFSHIADYIYDFCPLPDPDVGLSILVCDVEHTSYHFGLCRGKTDIQIYRQTEQMIKISHGLKLQCHPTAIQRRPVLRPERSLPHRPPTRICIIIYN